jgi:hypothetical protein
MKCFVAVILLLLAFSAAAQSFERIPLPVTGTLWPTQMKKGTMFIHSRADPYKHSSSDSIKYK